MKIKNEILFRRFSPIKTRPSQKGREQFVDHQSRGIKPLHPTKYFLALNDGKTHFDLLSNEYRTLYFSDEWWGWLQLWLDWEGERWILSHLCKWHPNIPEWLTLEIGKEELDRRFLMRQKNENIA